jgi:hypothetical protein
MLKLRCPSNYVIRRLAAASWNAPGAQLDGDCTAPDQCSVAIQSLQAPRRRPRMPALLRFIGNSL